MIGVYYGGIKVWYHTTAVIIIFIISTEEAKSRREATTFAIEKQTATDNKISSAGDNSSQVCGDKACNVAKIDGGRRSATNVPGIEGRSSLSGSGNARRNSIGNRGSSDFVLPVVPVMERVLSWRYVMVLLLHFSFVVSILQRNCLPIAMVCMIDPSPSVPTKGETKNTSVFYGNLAQNGRQEENSFELEWHAEVQGLILTAVSFSSFIAPLLVDFIRPHLGNKGTLTLTTLLASALTFVTPISARISPWLLFTVRLVIGMFFGGTVTIMGDSFAWWSPVSERQTMTAATLAGVNIGGMITSVVTGYLCLIPVDNGWPFIFYVFGSLGTAWAVLWHLFSSQKPEEHRFVSDREKRYIWTHRVGMDEWVGNKHKIPYKVIMTSPPVWALVTSVTCNQWTTNVYFTFLPAFLVKALGFTVQQAAIMLSLLSASRFVGHVCWTSLSNLMLSTCKMETTTARKAAICIGFWLCALTQCCIIFLEEHHTWPVVALLGVIMFNVSVGSCVATVLPLEMAPRFSGFLSGFAQSIGCLLSISGPLIVGLLTPHGSLHEWKIVWIIVAVVFAVSGFTFLVCGDASLQPWGQMSRDSMPTFAFPFVAMGRRFSAIINSSHLTTPLTSFGHFSHLSHLQSGIVSMNPKAFDVEQQTNNPRHRSNDTSNIDALPRKSGAVNCGFVKDVRG